MLDQKNPERNKKRMGQLHAKDFEEEGAGTLVFASLRLCSFLYLTLDVPFWLKHFR